jgi:hypothetical protein
MPHGDEDEMIHIEPGFVPGSRSRAWKVIAQWSDRALADKIAALRDDGSAETAERRSLLAFLEDAQDARRRPADGLPRP